MFSLDIFKQSKITAIEEAQRRIKNYEKQKLEKPLKVEKFDSLIALQQKLIQFHQSELSMVRPEKPEDMKERRRILTTYMEKIKQVFSDEPPVLFHGIKSLTYLEPILSSGHLGDVDGSSHGHVDVTGRDTFKITLDEFLGVHQSYPSFLPAGCLLVIAPKDKNEETAGSIPPFDFKKNPERIIAMVSTTENQEYIKNLCRKYGMATDKVFTFDAFIEKVQGAKKKGLTLTDRLAQHTSGISNLTQNKVRALEK